MSHKNCYGKAYDKDKNEWSDKKVKADSGTTFKSQSFLNNQKQNVMTKTVKIKKNFLLPSSYFVLHRFLQIINYYQYKYIFYNSKFEINVRKNLKLTVKNQK